MPEPVVTPEPDVDAPSRDDRGRVSTDDTPPEPTVLLAPDAIQPEPTVMLAPEDAFTRARRADGRDAPGRRRSSSRDRTARFEPEPTVESSPPSEDEPTIVHGVGSDRGRHHRGRRRALDGGRAGERPRRPIPIEPELEPVADARAATRIRAATPEPSRLPAGAAARPGAAARRARGGSAPAPPVAPRRRGHDGRATRSAGAAPGARRRNGRPRRSRAREPPRPARTASRWPPPPRRKGAPMGLLIGGGLAAAVAVAGGRMVDADPRSGRARGRHGRAAADRRRRAPGHASAGRRRARGVPTPAPAADVPVEEEVTIVPPPRAGMSPSPVPSRAPALTPPPTQVAAAPRRSRPRPPRRRRPWWPRRSSAARKRRAARETSTARPTLFDQALRADPGNAAATSGKAAVTAARAAARKAFMPGRTVVQTQSAKADLAGFDTADVSVKKAPDFSGRIEFAVNPPQVKPGDNYAVQIYLVNEGKKAIKVGGVTVTTNLNGIEVGPLGGLAGQGSGAQPARAARGDPRRVARGRQLVEHGSAGHRQQGRQPQEPADLEVDPGVERPATAYGVR